MNGKAKQKILTENLVRNAFVCTLYTCLTLFAAPLSFGAVQIRVSEVMTLLPFINPYLCPGLIMGCFISNLFSPFGMMDAVVGTLCTAGAVFCVSKTKNLFLATLWPTFFCVFIAVMISEISNIPFLATALSVMSGEFLAVTVIGYPLFRLMMKNKKWVSVIKNDKL